MTNNYFFSKRLSSVMCVLSTMTREWFGNGSAKSRLILGSNLSRLCLASLICLCMLTVGVGNVWGATLSITASNFGTSYSTEEQTFSVSDYTIGYQNVMKNQNGTPTGWATDQIIQMRKNASTYGRLYNKSEIIGLSKIRFWIQSGTNFQIYTGKSMINNTPESGALTLGDAAGSENISYTTYSKGEGTGSGSVTLSYYDIDITNGDTYFYITTGNTSDALTFKIFL